MQYGRNLNSNLNSNIQELPPSYESHNFSNIAPAAPPPQYELPPTYSVYNNINLVKIKPEIIGDFAKYFLKALINTHSQITKKTIDVVLEEINNQTRIDEIKRTHNARTQNKEHPFAKELQKCDPRIQRDVKTILQETGNLLMGGRFILSGEKLIECIREGIEKTLKADELRTKIIEDTLRKIEAKCPKTGQSQNSDRSIF